MSWPPLFQLMVAVVKDRVRDKGKVREAIYIHLMEVVEQVVVVHGVLVGLEDTNEKVNSYSDLPAALCIA